MADIFLKIVNMSITAGWIVIAVLVLRLLLKNSPKWINCILWGIVGIRLVFPFSFESVLSLIPSSKTISKASDSPRPYFESGVTIIDNQVNDYLKGRYFEGVTKPANHFADITTILSIIWIVGIVALLIYTIVSFLRVKRKIGTAVLLCDNIYQSENVISPFVLGVIRPKIYLPFNMNEQDMKLVIAHEQAHIRRKDHLWKPLGFLILTFHWFNPLMWIGYVLLCRDIELACDEKVVKEFNTEQKADYSQALLTCSVNRRLIAVCPLAFGEVGVKKRVKSVLNYKKPAFWVIVVAILVSVAVGVCFLTNPKDQRLNKIENLDLELSIKSTVSLVEHNGETFEPLTSFDMDLLLELGRLTRISNRPISSNRSDNRARTHTLVLCDQDNVKPTIYSHVDGTYICFNKSFTEVWIDTGVKSTLLYRVLNPSVAKEIYNDIVNFSDTNENKTDNDKIQSNPSNFTIIDRTEIEQISCGQAFEEFYRDSKYIYEFSCTKSQYVEVHYSNGNKENIKDALKNESVKINDLDRFNIKYSKKTLDDNNYNPYFNATVLEVYENSVLVKPFEGSDELKSSDKITVGTKLFTNHPVPELKKGMQIRIVYNGTIEETYPAQIPTAFAIYELREVDGELVPVIKTPLVYN